MSRELAERQTSLHQCQISELGLTLSNYKDKVWKNIQNYYELPAMMHCSCVIVSNDTLGLLKVNVSTS